MEAVRADGLLIDCSASQVIGSGGRQVQHAHELRGDVRSSSCRQTIRSSEARRGWREAKGMDGLMNNGGKKKESDARRKEKKKMATGASPKGPGWPRSWRIVSDRERFGRQMMGGAEGTLLEARARKLRRGKPQHVMMHVTLSMPSINSAKMSSQLVMMACLRT